jgi:hypothetical protein
MKHRVREFIKEKRFKVNDIGDGFGLGRNKAWSRLAGRTAWTAPEVVRFHAYLESEGVTVDLEELTRMCAADHGGE